MAAPGGDDEPSERFDYFGMGETTAPHVIRVGSTVPRTEVRRSGDIGHVDEENRPTFVLGPVESRGELVFPIQFPDGELLGGGLGCFESSGEALDRFVEGRGE